MIPKSRESIAADESASGRQPRESGPSLGVGMKMEGGSGRHPEEPPKRHTPIFNTVHFRCEPPIPGTKGDKSGGRARAEGDASTDPCGPGSSASHFGGPWNIWNTPSLRNQRTPVADHPPPSLPPSPASPPAAGSRPVARFFRPADSGPIAAGLSGECGFLSRATLGIGDWRRRDSPGRFLGWAGFGGLCGLPSWAGAARRRTHGLR